MYEKLKNFKGKNNSNGLDKNPENINREGANKGSRWRKTLLMDIMSLELNDSETVQFAALKSKHPKLFNGSEAQNFQLFMELRQVSLIFSQDERVAQAAIKEVKDRIDGKSEQVTKMDLTTKGEPVNKQFDYEKLSLLELETLKEITEKAEEKE
jgi:hypothetical protein